MVDPFWRGFLAGMIFLNMLGWLGDLLGVALARFKKGGAT